MKKPTTAFIMWCLCFIGLFGMHRFYVGRYWTGILWLCTFGLFGIGQIFDLFFIGSMVRQANLLNRLDAYGLGASAVAHTSNTNTVAPVINVHVTAPHGHATPPAVQAPSLASNQLPSAG